jgi:hypothetical protein
MMEAALRTDQRYAAALPGWDQRLDELIAWADAQMHELRLFAEHYDT